MDKVRTLRSLLIDNYPPIQDIDDNLLLLALTKTSKNFPSKLRKEQSEKYGSSDYERLEFLGDRVLDLIVSEILFDDFRLKSPGHLSDKLSRIVRNTSLYCLITNKNVCSLIVGTGSPSKKSCADLFESLLGALYYHLRLKEYPNSIEWLKRWLMLEWNLLNIIKHAISTKDKNICEFLGKEAEYVSSEEVEEKEEDITEVIFARKKLELGIPELEKEIEERLLEEKKRLEELSEDELVLQLTAIQREVSLRKGKTPRVILKELYDKHRWGKPNYILLRRKQSKTSNWIVGVECPPVVDCKETITFGRSKKKLLGIGKRYNQKEAYQNAADESIKTLEKMGYK